MESLKRKWSAVLLLLVVSSGLYAQVEENGVDPAEEKNGLNPAEEKKSAYIGMGIGFDYGGVGSKVEYLPVKHVGVFLAAGYNLLSVGWNLGVTCKLIPDKRVSPNLVAMYGYNAVLKGEDSYAEQYNMTSLGLTVGVNLDIKAGSDGNKWSVGLFLPFRSGKFMDNYEKVENDPNMEVKIKLLPIGISCGYNFKF
jgi:hypothetical protein